MSDRSVIATASSVLSSIEQLRMIQSELATEVVVVVRSIDHPHLSLTLLAAVMSWQIRD